MTPSFLLKRKKNLYLIYHRTTELQKLEGTYKNIPLLKDYVKFLKCIKIHWFQLPGMSLLLILYSLEPGFCVQQKGWVLIIYTTINIWLLWYAVCSPIIIQSSGMAPATTVTKWGESKGSLTVACMGGSGISWFSSPLVSSVMYMSLCEQILHVAMLLLCTKIIKHGYG